MQDSGWHKLQLQELQEVIRNVENTKQGKEFIQFITKKGYLFSLKESSGLHLEHKGSEGYFVTLVYRRDASHTAKLVYASNSQHSDVVVGATLTKQSDGSTQVDTYQVVSGTVTQVETAVLKGNNIQITVLKDASVRNVDLSSLAGTVQPLDSSCDNCYKAFDLLWNTGCTVTGAIMCLACGAAAETGVGAACAVACGLFWYYYCYLGESVNQCFICQQVQLCTSC
jgi:hypothetical protein